MAISALKGLNGYGKIYNPSINDGLSTTGLYNVNSSTDIEQDEYGNFDSILQSCVNGIEDVSQKINLAEDEEIMNAAGEDNELELMIAQSEASVALSTAVAVKNKLVESYKEIMNMQF